MTRISDWHPITIALTVCVLAGLLAATVVLAVTGNPEGFYGVAGISAPCIFAWGFHQSMN